MSTDISIKPAATLVTTIYTPPPNSGARDAVPTQLPAPQAVTSIESSARVSSDISQITPRTTNKVVIDKDAAAIVFQTVDDRTSEVIGQYPAEGVLRRRAYLLALDHAKAETGKSSATDRKA